MTRPSFSLLLPLVASLACSTPQRSSVDAQAARDASGDVTDESPATDDVPPCSVRPDASDVACVLHVRGRAVDFAGTPLVNQVITYCGPACFGANTDARGDFDVLVGDFINPSVYSLLVHGRPNHASLYVVAPSPVGGVVTFSQPLAVPRYESMSAPIPRTGSAGSYTAGDVTLTVATGTTVEFDVEDYELGELGRRVRAVYVPSDRAPPFARDQGLSALWALGPNNMISSAPMAVRVANRAGLPANAAVDFVVLGNEIVVPPPTAGHPIVAAAGHVSSDGATVSTDPGAGLSFITWLGVRPRR